jgi:hypothetical protein
MSRISAFLVPVLFAFLFTAPSAAQMQVVLSRAPTFSPQPGPDPGIFGADFVMPPSFHNTDDRPGVPLLGDSTITLFAFCFDPITFNLVVCNVQLAIHAEEGSGGHVHTAGRPDGTLDHTSGLTTTDPSNPLQFVYTAPDASGVTDATLTGTDLNGNPIIPVQATIGVEIDGLIGNPTSLAGGLLTIDPISQNHDSNNINSTPTFSNQLQFMAIDFRLRLVLQCIKTAPNPLAALNCPNTVTGPVPNMSAMNLPAGGLFDFQGTWAPPHHDHRVGVEGDMRITNPNFLIAPRFRIMLHDAVIDALMDDPVPGEDFADPSSNHWHLVGLP